jgi:hypothetical protein
VICPKHYLLQKSSSNFHSFSHTLEVHYLLQTNIIYHVLSYIGICTNTPVFHWLLLIPRVVVIQIKRKSLRTLCTSLMWRAFQKRSSVWGIVKTLVPYSKLNTLFGVHSWEPDHKEICNKWYTASKAFPVTVADATLAKQGDHYLCSSANISTISEMIFKKYKN